MPLCAFFPFRHLIGEEISLTNIAEFCSCLAAGRKKKQRHGEAVVPPRSLFDRATPGMLKIRREGKEQKKNLLLKQQTPFAKPLPTYVKSSGEPAQDSPDWLIGEDWALLQVNGCVIFGLVGCSPHWQFIVLCGMSLTQEKTSPVHLKCIHLCALKSQPPGCKAVA